MLLEAVHYTTQETVNWQAVGSAFNKVPDVFALLQPPFSSASPVIQGAAWYIMQKICMLLKFTTES